MNSSKVTAKSLEYQPPQYLRGGIQNSLLFFKCGHLPSAFGVTKKGFKTSDIKYMLVSQILKLIPNGCM